MVQEKELDGLRNVIIELTNRGLFSADSKVDTEKLHGRKSEKSGRLTKRRDDCNIANSRADKLNHGITL